MSKIKAKKYGGRKEVWVVHKDLYFGYCRPNKRDIKHEGRRLDIGTRGRHNMTFSLNGTQINTLKKILKAAGEI